jgi:hypothetical protein
MILSVENTELQVWPGYFADNVAGILDRGGIFCGVEFEVDFKLGALSTDVDTLLAGR